MYLIILTFVCKLCSCHVDIWLKYAELKKQHQFAEIQLAHAYINIHIAEQEYQLKEWVVVIIAMLYCPRFSWCTVMQHEQRICSHRSFSTYHNNIMCGSKALLPKTFMMQYERESAITEVSAHITIIVWPKEHYGRQLYFETYKLNYLTTNQMVLCYHYW